MISIVGLGNPGKKFEKTRHNLGFRVIDLFAKKNKFPKFEFSEKLSSLISEGSVFGKEVLLIKPQTFMNNSGKALKLVVQHLKIDLENLWIIHDDLDFPLGKIKIVKNRGSAGHKGVQSIIEELKSKDFVRFRLGIGREERKSKKDFVLEKFTKEEEKILKKVIKKVIEAIEFSLKEGIEKGMAQFNRS